MSLQIVRLILGPALLAVSLVSMSGCAPSTLNPDPAPARNDGEYCAQLSYLYQRYLSGNQISTKTSGDSDLASQVAVVQCEQGNSAAGIPVLERKLRANGFTLPPRP